MNRALRIVVIIAFVLILLVVSATIVFKRLEQNLQGLKDLSIEGPNLSTLRDGTYEGSYATFPIKVKVEATIKKGTLSNITLLEHRNGQGKQAEAILATVLNEQRLDVDTISGATYSSVILLKAIEQALQKAESL